MKIYIISIMILVIGCSSSELVSKYNRDKIEINCTEDNDCILESGVCGYITAVSKNARQKNINHPDRYNLGEQCLVPVNESDYRAVCKESICIAERLNK